MELFNFVVDPIVFQRNNLEYARSSFWFDVEVQQALDGQMVGEVQIDVEREPYDYYDESVVEVGHSVCLEFEQSCDSGNFLSNRFKTQDNLLLFPGIVADLELIDHLACVNDD